MVVSILKRTAQALVAAALVGVLSLPGAAYATDGHFLHGVGAINSAMGGAGIAYPGSLLGTYYLNPAGLMAFNKTRIEFGFEMFKPERSVSSGFGSFQGSTVSKSDYVPIPAMAFSIPIGDKAVIGLGGLGIGGFGVDYPADMSNPILMPQPYGFGQVYSDYGLLKFTPSLAFALSDDLWVGVSANVAYATLSVGPMPTASPAVSFGDDGSMQAFYSDATAKDGAFGFGFGAGLMYRLDRLTLGATYQSNTWFQDFDYTTTWANPALPNYGTSRNIAFCLDIPAVYGVGAAWEPTEQFVVTADMRRILYGGTAGFELANAAQPFDQTGAVPGFGWESIWVYAAGTEYDLGGLRLRGGYNYSENPIPDDLSMINVPAPGVVQSHLTLGLGVDVAQGFALDLAYYHAFKNDVTGPLWSPLGPITGSFVTSELSENSFLMMFSYAPGR